MSESYGWTNIFVKGAPPFRGIIYIVRYSVVVIVISDSQKVKREGTVLV